MRLNNILSNELPEIDASIKECVNFGQWLLFKSDPKLATRVEVVFYLKTSDNVFGLDGRGHILETLEVNETNLPINELFYFSDIRQPTSLSNIGRTIQ